MKQCPANVITERIEEIKRKMAEYKTDKKMTLLLNSNLIINLKILEKLTNTKQDYSEPIIINEDED